MSRIFVERPTAHWNVQFPGWDEPYCYEVVVGDSDYISRLYRRIRARWESDKSPIAPSHYEFPAFIEGRMYGLCIDPADGYFSVLNSNTLLSWVIDPEIRVESYGS